MNTNNQSLNAYFQAIDGQNFQALDITDTLIIPNAEEIGQLLDEVFAPMDNNSIDYLFAILR
jgi:hypothetical protein